MNEEYKSENKTRQQIAYMHEQAAHTVILHFFPGDSSKEGIFEDTLKGTSQRR